MRKNIGFIAFLLFAVVFVACSDSDDYNADAAVSSYEPSPGRKVAQIKTVSTVDGRDYSWEHNFSYDAHGRIKETSTSVTTYISFPIANNNFLYKRYNLTSKTNYYFNGDDLSVEYSISSVCPDDSRYNGADDDSGKRYGSFGKNGKLASYSSLDFQYTSAQLTKAYQDGGRMFVLQRDASGCVTGYQCYDQTGETDALLIDCGDEFKYGSLRNKTNFDFAGYLGFWGVERAVYELDKGIGNPYQLSAIGLLGTPSPNLPYKMLARDKNSKPIKDEAGNPVYVECRVELDAQGCPVSFVDGSGRKTSIKYVD